LDELRRRFAQSFEQVDGKTDKYHLHRILESRQSQCLGNCQLLIVLGGAVGLDVRPLDVMLPAKGGLGEHMFHNASIVRLADGRVRMVDERWDLDSPPFVFTEHYGPEGVHWRLLDDGNPLGLHRLIRVRDVRGLKADLWTSIGYSRLKASRLDEARDFFARAHEHDPESTFTLLALAQIAAAEGKWGEVDALLAKSLQLDPERAEVHAFRARLAAGAGRRRDALAAYHVAILLFPESPDALCERGLLHRDLGDEEEAIADLTESLRIRPQHGPALVGRGGLYAQRGENGLALADFDAAIAADSGDALAHLQRGVALAHLGRKVEARRSMEASITADPESRRRAEAAIQRFGL
jgi:tetratricopeptide (TPR) repeat protein